MKSVAEYIVDNIPYAKQTREHFLPQNVYIDTTSIWLKEALKKAYQMKDATRHKRLKSIVVKNLAIGSYVYSNDDKFGLGRVVRFFDTDDSLMLVHFNERELPTMCSRNNLTTVHDETNRKLKIIY